MGTVARALTLEAFLELPETKPASELIKGGIVQKPMPQGEHSRLQGKLCEVIIDTPRCKQTGILGS